jgi:hypothetical protein
VAILQQLIATYQLPCTLQPAAAVAAASRGAVTFAGGWCFVPRQAAAPGVQLAAQVYEALHTLLLQRQPQVGGVDAFPLLVRIVIAHVSGCSAVIGMFALA